MSERRVTAVHKASLAGLSFGWGEECYAIVEAANYQDWQAVDGVDRDDKSAQFETQTEMVKSHFVAGKIKLWQSDGTQILVDMTVDDVTCSKEVLDALAAAILGIDTDPKDMRGEAARTKTPDEDGNSTETLSSTETVQTLTETSPES